MKNALTLFIFCIAIFALTGCEDIEAQARVVSSDPSKALSAYATMTCGLAFLLFFFTERNAWGAMLDAIRLGGVICLATSPLLWLVTNDVRTSVAIGVSGLLGFVAISVMYAMRQRPEMRKTEEEKDE